MLRRLRTLGLGLVLVLGACADPPIWVWMPFWDWHPRRTQVGSSGVVLPEAHCARLGRRAPRKPLFVWVKADGTATWKRVECRLVGGSAFERHGHGERLQEEIRQLNIPVEPGQVPFAVHVVADRSAPWGAVGTLLGWTCDREALGTSVVQRLEWSVHTGAEPDDSHQAAQVGPPAPVANEERPMLRFWLEDRRDDQGRVDVVLRELGLHYAWPEEELEERAWHFGPGAGDLEDADVVARANRVWLRLGYDLLDLDWQRGDLDAWPAVLSVKGDRIPWAYVAKVLDLLLAYGIRVVRIPELDLELTLAAPDRIPWQPPPGAPLLTITHLALMLLAALLAAVVTFAPIRRKREERV